MPQGNSYLGSGSPYPTGKSPLVLDIENNIQNVVQQRVENTKAAIREKKLTISENEKTMLDALDMQPIEGMSDKVALDFADGLEKIKDKYARKFYEQEGQFSAKDKLELRKDQMQQEQKLKNAAAEIKAIAEVKKQLAVQSARPDRKGLYEFYPTSKWITDYEKSGEVGSGQFLNGVIFSQPTFGEEFISKYEPLVANNAKSTDQTIRVLNPATGLYETRTTTRRTDAEVKDYLLKTPEGQMLMQQDPIQFNSLVSDMVKRYSLNKSEQDFNSGLQRQNTSGTANELQAIDFYNNLAQGIITGDKAILSSLSGAVDKKLGTLKNVEFQEGAGSNPDRIILFPNDPKKSAEAIDIPSENASEDAILQFKRNLIERLIIGNTQADKKTLASIEANWNKGTKSEPAMPLNIKNAVSYLKNSPEDLEKSTRKKAETDENATVIDKTKYRDYIISTIKSILPDKIVETRNRSGLGIGQSPNRIRVYDNADKTTFTDYDLREEADRKKLSGWIVEQSKYKERLSKKYGYTQSDTSFKGVPDGGF